MDAAAPSAYRRLITQVFLAAAITALLYVTLLNCGAAFFFPLELEQREGGAWLHVLAMRAGVSLYDHQQVAFLNMNHGPLDPLLKYLLSEACPFLSPAMITRCFVLLLPAGLVVAMIAGSRRRVAGLAWGLGLYLFILGLQPPSFLVGRSDPTALFLLALLLAILAGPLRRACESGRREALWSTVTGLVAGMVVLTNWRFLPAVGAVVAGCGFEYWSAAGPARRLAGFVRLAAWFAAAAGALFVLILLIVFHGDVSLYYRHFFGFFLPESGWGALRKGGFELLPPALVLAHWPVHLLAAAVAGLGLGFPSAQLPRHRQLQVWLPLLALLWLTCCVAYYLNRSGGGVWYFAMFYLVLAFHLARAVAWEEVALPGLREAVGLGLLGTLPWLPLLRQASLLGDSFAPAYAFLHECRAIAGDERIHSENFYFFEDRYAGEKVDMGDVVHQVAPTGYYGPALTETANRYFAQLRADPPPFVIAGECGSPVLNELLAREYQPVLLISPSTTRYAGSAQTFYRRKPAVK